MAQCTNCGSYTKFDGGLCYTCYQEKNGANHNKSTVMQTEGLTDKEYDFRYSMIKGRIAETLIPELFLSLKYNVFRYGMENTIPGIMELLKGVKGEVADEIRRMPDFVVQNPRTNDVFFIEVKFRSNETFTRANLPANYPWHNAFIILVSKKHIKCLSFHELENGEEITPSSRNYLGNRKEFELDKETIIEFCDFAVQFFEGV